MACGWQFLFLLGVAATVAFSLGCFVGFAVSRLTNGR